MSRDTALELLLPLLHAEQGAALWIIDEHGGALSGLAARDNISVLSNRCNVAGQMQASGWQSHFSDFDFSPWQEQALSGIYFRLAKEKPLVHHIINAAAERLKPGGKLYLAGSKQQGIKTYAKSAGQRLAGKLQIKKTGNAYLAIIERGSGVAGMRLDDRDYSVLRPIVRAGDLNLYSKPGLYGWDKVDEGSALLVEQFPSVRPAANILDLGCGYGYLSVQAWQYFQPERIVATDNNAAAILAARTNFASQQIPGGVIAADCGSGIEEHFDLLLCNPPFHQGFAVERGMTEYFVRNARRLSTDEGEVLFVVNRFLPLEKVARTCFTTIRELADNGRFRVLLMQP